MINFVSDSCFGLIDIEDWNETFVREPSGSSSRTIPRVNFCGFNTDM